MKRYQLICCQTKEVIKEGANFTALRAKADALNAEKKNASAGINYTVRKA